VKSQKKGGGREKSEKQKGGFCKNRTVGQCETQVENCSKKEKKSRTMNIKTGARQKPRMGWLSREKCMEKGGITRAWGSGGNEKGTVKISTVPEGGRGRGRVCPGIPLREKKSVVIYHSKINLGKRKREGRKVMPKLATC